LWLNRALCGITWQYTLLEKKEENNSAEKEEFLSLSSPPLLPCTRKMKTYKVESWCTMPSVTGLNSAGCKEKIAVEEAIF